jgi:hypothetical protein
MLCGKTEYLPLSKHTEDGTYRPLGTGQEFEQLWPVIVRSVTQAPRGRGCEVITRAVLI